jgi:thiol-disulfide isomerase/thioredoxin
MTRSTAGDGELALDELGGIPVVLNFWASWCDSCAEEAPGSSEVAQGGRHVRASVLAFRQRLFRQVVEEQQLRHRVVQFLDPGFVG